MAEGGGDPGRPSRISDLPGLLRLAVEAGSEEDAAPGPQGPLPMSIERRQWLQEALSVSMSSAQDDVQLMKQALDILRAGPGGHSEAHPGPPLPPPPEPDAEAPEDLPEVTTRLINALDALLDVTDNIDNAQDFCKLGGMALVVRRYLDADSAELRWRAAELVATCAQNAPHVQEAALELGALTRLLRRADADADTRVRVKALLAVSCLVREQPLGRRALAQGDGFSVLLRAMQDPGERPRAKAAFLLHSLLMAGTENHEELCAMGMVQQLVALLHAPHEPFHEHVLGALLSLVSGHGAALRESRAAELRLRETLLERIGLLEGSEQHLEALEFCRTLLQLTEAPGEEVAMDR